MEIAITIGVMWLAVGAFQLYALARFGRGLDWQGAIPMLSLVFVVVCWPAIVWEHTRMTAIDLHETTERVD